LWNAGETRHLNVDNLVADERLEEDADEAHEPVLHVAVLGALAGVDAVGDVEVQELLRQLHRLKRQLSFHLNSTRVYSKKTPHRGEPIDHLHAVQRHLHADQCHEVPGTQNS